MISITAFHQGAEKPVKNGELRAYLIRQIRANCPPMTSADAVQLGQIEAYLWDRSGKNPFELLDLAAAVAVKLGSVPRGMHVKVNFDQIAMIVGNAELCRIALLRNGIFAQTCVHCGRTWYASTPRGSVLHMAKKLDFGGLVWNGQEFKVREND